MAETATKGKPGRKPLNPGEKRQTVSTSLEASLYDALNEYRWSHRIETVGEVVRMAVKSFVEAAPAESPASPTEA